MGRLFLRGTAVAVSFLAGCGSGSELPPEFGGTIRADSNELIFEVKHCAFDPEVPGNRATRFQLDGVGNGFSVRAEIRLSGQASSIVVARDEGSTVTLLPQAPLVFDPETRSISGMVEYAGSPGALFTAHCPQLTDGQTDFERGISG